MNSDILGSANIDDQSSSLKLPRDLNLKVEQLSPSALSPSARNTRRHSKKQIHQIAASIRRFGFVVPVLVGPDQRVVAGHGRLAAAELLNMAQVPVIRLEHLTASERKAYAIADNRLNELSSFDEELLALELSELAALDLDFDLEITGFDGSVLDRLLDPNPIASDAADKLPEAGGPAVSRIGDVWILGRHRLICDDARTSNTFSVLMAGEQARMVFTDPPYNVPIDGHVGGNGKIARRDFVMGSGEMAPDQFQGLLHDALANAAAVTVDGGIHFACMDWRSITVLIEAGRQAGLELKNLIAWVKDNAGMGSFYRSQHELIAAFKVGSARHVNNFGLGGTGRYRSNVWTYPGANSFGRGRDEMLALHPTVKPVALVADAIKDVSRRNEIVLDPFGGSGTTIIAAERVGRRAYLIELDPLYCDTICRRWKAFSGEDAIMASSGRSFGELEAACPAEACDV